MFPVAAIQFLEEIDLRESESFAQLPICLWERFDDEAFDRLLRCENGAGAEEQERGETAG
jgi:hypothetical protein